MVTTEKTGAGKRSGLIVALVILGEVFFVTTFLVTAYYSSLANLQFSTSWADSKTIIPGAGGWLEISEQSNYAGYVTVVIQSSTTNNIYVQTTWSSNGINYNNNVTVGTDGKAVFLVLPSRVDIRIGTTNEVNGATAKLTVTYKY